MQGEVVGGGISFALVAVGFLQAVVYLLFIRAVDLYEREELKFVIPVFAWGFLVATTVSLFFNTIFAFTLSTVVSDAQAVSFFTAVFVAPVVEECAKGAALLIAFAVASVISLRRGYIEFSGVMDGIVYGSAVGFGFSIAEDILYYAQTYQEFGAQVYAARRIFGGFGHAAFTAVTGIGIGLIPWVRPVALKILLPVVGLLGAIFLHATFNFTASLFGPLAYVLEFLVLLSYVVVIVAWLAVERRTIRRELYEEVSAGTISAREYEILPTYFARTYYYLGLVLSGRLREYRRARKVHEAAVDLAFTKRLSRQSYAAPQQGKVDLLRRRIAERRRGRQPLGTLP